VASMLGGAVTVQGVRARARSLVFGGKGVTTDKPFVLGACGRDKVPVCCRLGGKQLAVEPRRGRNANSRSQLIAYASTSRARRSHWQGSTRGGNGLFACGGSRMGCVRCS
jgi:hypothetical protein